MQKVAHLQVDHSSRPDQRATQNTSPSGPHGSNTSFRTPVFAQTAICASAGSLAKRLSSTSGFGLARVGAWLQLGLGENRQGRAAALFCTLAALKIFIDLTS